MADQPSSPTEPGTLRKALSKVDAGMRAMANTATFGYADKFAAWADSKFNKGSYKENLALQKELTEFDAKTNPEAVLVGQVAGVAATAVIGGNLVGAGKAIHAGYTGATVTATTAAAGTSAAAPAAEAASTAAKSAKPLVSHAKDMIGQAATKTKDVIMHPIASAKTAGKFVATQASALVGSLAVEVASDLTADAVVGKANAATGSAALDSDKSKLAAAGTAGVAAIGLSKLAAGMSENGKRGVLKKIVQATAVMTGFTAATNAITEVAASSAVSSDQVGPADKPVTTGILAATATAGVGVLAWKKIGPRQAWEMMSRNTSSLATAATLNLAPLIPEVDKRMDQKVTLASQKPAAPTATQGETKLAQAPQGTAEEIVSAPAVEPIQNKASATPQKVATKAVPHSSKAKSSGQSVDQRAEGTLVGLSLTGQPAPHLPTPALASLYFMQPPIATEVAEAAVPTTPPAEKVDLSQLNQSLQAGGEAKTGPHAGPEQAENPKNSAKPFVTVGTPKLNNLG